MNIKFAEEERSEIYFFYGYLDGNSKAAAKKSGSVFPTAAKQAEQTLAGHIRGCELKDCSSHTQHAALRILQVIACLILLEDIQTIGSCCLYVFCYYHILSYSLCSIFYQCIYGCILPNTVIYVFLLLCLRILIV